MLGLLRRLLHELDDEVLDHLLHLVEGAISRHGQDLEQDLALHRLGLGREEGPRW